MNDDHSGDTDNTEEPFDPRVSESFKAIRHMAVPDTWPTPAVRGAPWQSRRLAFLAVAAAIVLFGGVFATVRLTSNDGSGAVLASSETSQPLVVFEPSSLVLAAKRVAPTTSSTVAGSAITELGFDLFGKLRLDDPEANVTLSPTSIAIALAMLEPGTVGASRDQIRTLLRITNADQFHASMNALEQDLESRVTEASASSPEPGELTIGIANAAYLQRGYPFEPDYLRIVGSNYGPVLREVDFGPDPDAVAHEINDFVAEETNDLIVDLIDDGVIEPDTVLALVNALYLEASWTTPFETTATEDGAFKMLDGTPITVPLMHGSGSTSASGDGWVGATKRYVGGLSAHFILPDEGRFGEVAARVPSVFDDYTQNRRPGAQLVVPRFETRTSTELDEIFIALGLTGPYNRGGLLGIAPDPDLRLYKSIHETFLSMDEEGVEAAAATVLLAGAVSFQPPGIAVVLDRPFLYRIIDDASGATLFIGQITNPTT